MLCNTQVFIYSCIALLYNTLKFGNVHIISTYSKTQFPTMVSIYCCKMPLMPEDTAIILNASPCREVLAESLRLSQSCLNSQTLNQNQVTS